MSSQLNEYDVVRIVAIPDASVVDKVEWYQRPPRIGDRATVLECYANPPGYELEYYGPDGRKIWLGGFSPDDLVLAVEWASPTKT